MSSYLFGVVTTRNPSVIAESDRSRFHITLDEQDRQQTRLWSNLAETSFIELKREVVSRVRSGAFTVPNLHGIRGEHSNHIRLFHEINAEHNRASLAALPGFVASLSLNPLTRQQRVDLWDAFAFYLWADPQRDEIEMISAILVADKVLGFLRVSLDGDSAIDEEEEAAIRRVGRARIVLPLRVDNRLTGSPSWRLSARQRRMILSAHDQIVALRNVGELERAREEIVNTLVRVRETRRVEQAREADLRAANLRSRLAGRVPASDLAAVTADLASSLQPPERETPAVADVSALLETDTARRAFERASRGKNDPSAALDVIEAEIAEANDVIEPALPTLHSATVLAYGAELTVEEQLPIGALALKMHRNAGQRGYHVYLTYHHGSEVPPLSVVAGTLQDGASTMQISAEMISEEDTGFQTFRLTSAPIDSAFVEASLTLVSLSPDASPMSLDPIRVFSGQPHAEVVDLPVGEGEIIAPPPILFGVTRLGVVEYRRVEQELSCYVTGEISRIENILASEFKERVSRSLSLIESEQEITQETASEYQTDTETSEKLEMQAEVAEVLSEEREKTFDAGVSVTAGFGDIAELTADTAFHYNTVSSKEESTTETIETAKSVTRKVQRRLMQKATGRRRSLSRREFEDINKHGFDNRQNPDHVVGVYRFVDKIYTHHLVNLGAREMIEIVIPEPAKAFIFAQQEVQAEEDSPKVRRPRRPRRIGLTGPESLNGRTWRKFAAAYGVELAPPPPRKITVSRAFAETPGVATPGGDDDQYRPGSFSGSAYNEIDVPEGYVATKASVRLSSDKDPNSTELNSVSVIVADHRLPGASWIVDLPEFDIPNIAEIVPVAIESYSTPAYAVTVTITCSRRRSTYRRWQLTSYGALMEAYRGLKAVYDEAKEEQEETQSQLDLNPRFKRQHMERELKRICIEMLTRRFGVEISANHYAQNDGDEFPRLRQSPALVRHAQVVKFFEQAFDWSIMSYIFYPYFYGPKKDWSVKLSLEASKNQLFSSFLSSGMARVLLPVRPGMEDAVNYYLDTGEIWFGGGFVLDAKNDLYLSIADELITGRGRESVIEDTWETRLPTNHTILQSAASALIEDGLPCHGDGDRIGQGQSTLAPVLSPASPDQG